MVNGSNKCFNIHYYKRNFCFKKSLLSSIIIKNLSFWNHIWVLFMSMLHTLFRENKNFRQRSNKRTRKVLQNIDLQKTAKHCPFSSKEEVKKLRNYNQIIVQVNFCQKHFLLQNTGENILCTKIVLNVRNNFCTQHVLPRFELGVFMSWTCKSMNNLSSYCGLVDAKSRASDKDLPVPLPLICFC